jgi:hypothetical protein
LEEKVRRMEGIVSEGNSDIYREFVDFRQMAAQIEMMCSHDHELNQSLRDSDTLTTFMDSHKDDNHDQYNSPRGKTQKKETGKEADTKNKRKKKQSWFGLLLGK